MSRANPLVQNPFPVTRMVMAPGITLQNLIYVPSPVVSSIEDKETLCNLVVKQVFGNAYVMESEREEVYMAESMFRRGAIPLKEFVRACALSSTYRRRFFECCGPYRAVELNFKHLLGRGPNSQAEISEHVQRMVNEGFEAEINSYIDSIEYDQKFGEDDIPGMVFKGTYTPIEEFNRMCAIYSSPGTTDKSLTIRAKQIGVENPNTVLSLDGAGVSSKLVSLASEAKVPTPFTNVKKGIPSRPDLEHGVDVNVSLIQPTAPVVNEDSAPRKRFEVSMGNYMYLTEEEAEMFRAQNLEERQIESLVKAERQAASDEIERLQGRIDELSAVI